METDGPKQPISAARDSLVEKTKATLGPLYRTARYDVVQPARNRLAFHRRLSKVPAHDVNGRDVLIVVVDCLRPDHLSINGYERDTTPFLDSVGTHYPNCVSAASWTYSAVPSILTGLYPHNHGAVFQTASRNFADGDLPASLRDDVHTVSEILAQAGYETYLSTAITTAELSVRGRFKRAKVHADGHYDAPAGDLITRLLEWWGDTEQSRFGYVHLGDLHQPLRRPETLPFGEIPDIPRIEEWDYLHSTEPREAFEEYRRARIRLYDSNLRYIDTQIRRLFEALVDRNELEDTLVVVLGDHGEEFWERVELERQHFHDPRDTYGTGHGHALVPEVVSVPLIVVGGDDQQTDDHVSTTDVVPTILTELGLDNETLTSYDGQPLQRPVTDRVVLSEEIAYGYDQQAVVHGPHHFIDSPHEDQSVLLDVPTGDLRDDPELEAELRQHLTGTKHAGGDTVLDSETRERLADLGYI